MFQQKPRLKFLDLLSKAQNIIIKRFLLETIYLFFDFFLRLEKWAWTNLLYDKWTRNNNKKNKISFGNKMIR